MGSFSAQNPPLVFVPGIKGSHLLLPEQGHTWLTWHQGLGLSTPDLRLPLRWQDGRQPDDGMVAGDALCWILSQPIYGPFLHWAKTARSMLSFTYDWRRDNLDHASSLLDTLDRIANEASRPIQVIGHSMGGLITLSAMQRRPEIFHSALFVGTPFGPSISGLEDLTAGTATGLNRSILGPEVLFTFVSPYSFFPEAHHASALMDAKGRELPHNWYSAEDWEARGLGLFARLADDGVTADHRSHLASALKRATAFRRSLDVRSNVRWPPIAVLASDGHPTLAQAVVEGPGAVNGWDFWVAPRPPGDGRVVFQAALPPDPIPYTLYLAKDEHSQLLNNTRRMSIILDHLTHLGER